MSNRRVFLLLTIGGLSVFALVTGVSVQNRSLEVSVGTAAEPQCGHWAVLRCCQLLGAPTGMAAVMELMPPMEKGHSLEQLATTLGRIGLSCEGRRETLDSLLSGSFPCVAHLRNPDHFVVIASVEQNRVHQFDGRGRRATIPTKNFEDRWSGNVLWVRRPKSGSPLPACQRRSDEAGPCIQFETLLVDKGNVPAVGEPIEFVYPFQNVGHADLVIEKIRTSCKCLDTKKPNEPVPPGGTGEIQLTYRVRAEAGPFDHEAVVQSNDTALPVIKLKASGNTYTGVKVRPDRLNLGEVIVGEPCSRACYVAFGGDWEGPRVEQVTSTLKGATFVHYSTEDAVRMRQWAPEGVEKLHVLPCTEVVELNFVPDLSSLGEIEGAIFVHTKARGFERISVPVIGRAVLPVSAYPAIVHFGEVSENEIGEQVLTLSSRVNRLFRFIAVEADSEELEILVPDSDWHEQADVRLRVGGGSTSWALNNSFVRINVQLGQTDQIYTLTLPVRIWKRGS